jgi:hypothetical protein
MADLGHSPLGFSGAERYMNCAGSVALTAALPPDVEQPDPEYTTAGVNAHAAWAWCLKNQADAWQAVGEGFFHDFSVQELEAGQFYLDYVRRMKEEHFAFDMLVEEQLAAPEIHEKAWGTVDCALFFYHHGQLACRIIDYKHGEGRYVEAEWNKQTCGYGGLVAVRFPKVQRFFLDIVQPRLEGSPDVRTFEVHREPLLNFVNKTLQPAMVKADEMPFDEALKNLKVGEHCRFCPVKRALRCPEMNQLPVVLEQIAPLLARMSTERLGELYGKKDAMIMLLNELESEVFRRRMAGEDVPNSKTVLKKVFRAWKDGALNVLAAAFGEFEVQKIVQLGPKEIEDKFGKPGKELVKAWAFTPDAGYTVAPLSDRRRAVNPPALTANKFDKFLDKAKLSE